MPLVVFLNGPVVKVKDELERAVSDKLVSSRALAH
jgi:hypothetical protein